MFYVIGMNLPYLIEIIKTNKISQDDMNIHI